MKYVCVLFSVLVVGCEPAYYIKSESDESYSFDKDKKIYIYISDSSSIAERNFGHFISSQAEKLGFNTVRDIDSSDIAISYSITNDSKDVPQQAFIPFSNTTYGNVGTTRFQSTSTQLVSYSYVKHIDTQRIYLCAYDSKNVKHPIVWTGYIGSTAPSYKYYATEIVNKILTSFGKQIEIAR